jgi:hypothetical protein
MQARTQQVIAVVLLCLLVGVGSREAAAQAKYRLSSADPATRAGVSELTFFPKLRQMTYQLRIWLSENFSGKGPHLVLSLGEDSGRSPDINGDRVVNNYDFIDNVLPIADVSNAKGPRYRGEGNVYLANFQLAIARGGAEVKVVSGNVGTVNSGMQAVFGQYNKVCGYDDRYICIPLDTLAPGDYTVSWRHPKVGAQTVASFTLSGPGGAAGWVEHIKAGLPFKVVFDVASQKFRDTDRMGEVNPLGTIKAGETYTVAFAPQTGWTATGYNKASGGVGTWAYQPGSPDSHEVDIWGRVFKFSDTGEVFDLQQGLVGHLAR